MGESSNTARNDLAFLAGGGELGELIRTFDWAQSPLGPAAEWPRSLKTAVRIMLTSRQPIWIGWGRDLVYLYNDPYKSIIGGKHPWALGRSTAEVWREICTDIGPMLSKAMGGQEGTYVEKQLLVMERNGYPEETYYTFSYSPIPDDDGAPGGIICANTEDTAKVVGERQMALLAGLAAGTAHSRSWRDVGSCAADALAANPHDLVFALVYIEETRDGPMVLAGSAGIAASHPAAPARIEDRSTCVWAIEAALVASDMLVQELGADRVGAPFPKGPWREPAARAAILPIVVARGQGGLLDVALDQKFADNRTVYLSFADPREGGKNGTSLARARLTLDETGGRLEETRIIFRQLPAWSSNAHFGSRIVFARDGSLFLTVGDRYAARDEAQKPENHIGKVLRLNPDGTPHAGNPKKPGWAPEVWSIGHRNVQAAAIHPDTGQLWTIEHGARGGDEVNRPEAGKNYGWPVITYGRDYSGVPIGVGARKDGLEQPVYYWDPSIAPSGATFYSGRLAPDWKGNLFVGALAGSHVARLVLKGNEIVAEEKLLTDRGDRFRAVTEGPDGALYLLTDDPKGEVLRVEPRG